MGAHKKRHRRGKLPENQTALCEVVTLRGMPYVPHDELFKAYQKQQQIAAGTFGVIFGTQDPNFVIKQCHEIHQQPSFTNELAAHAQFQHPCILRPSAWTIKGTKGYFVMRRGSDLFSALRRKWITLEQIFADLVAVFGFLHEHGWVHGDVSPVNMVFLENKCMLIDFGAAKRATLHEDGQYYVKSRTNQLWYQDPRYLYNHWNDMRHELYSIFAVVQAMYLGKHVTPGSLYWFCSENYDLNTYAFAEATEPACARSPIAALLDLDAAQEPARTLLPRRHAPGVCFPQPFLRAPYRHSHLRFLIGNMCGMTELCHKRGFSCQSLILALHLVHLSCRQVFAALGDLSLLSTYVLVCLHLALAHEESDYQIMMGLDDVHEQCAKHIDADEYRAIFMNTTRLVLQSIAGVSSPLTYWHFARSGRDLPNIIFQMVTCSFDPDFIAQSDESVTDKCLTVEQALSQQELDFYRTLQVDTPIEDLYATVPKVPRATVPLPCHFALDVSIQETEKVWSGATFKLDDKDDDFLQAVALLMRTSHDAHLLPQDVAKRIFMKLCACFRGHIAPGLVGSILDKLTCKSAWREPMSEYFQKVLCSVRHPFPPPPSSEKHLFSIAQQGKEQQTTDTTEDAKRREQVICHVGRGLGQTHHQAQTHASTHVAAAGSAPSCTGRSARSAFSHHNSDVQQPSEFALCVA